MLFWVSQLRFHIVKAGDVNLLLNPKTLKLSVLPKQCFKDPDLNQSLRYFAPKCGVVSTTPCLTEMISGRGTAADSERALRMGPAGFLTLSGRDSLHPHHDLRDQFFRHFKDEETWGRVTSLCSLPLWNAHETVVFSYGQLKFCFINSIT